MRSYKFLISLLRFAKRLLHRAIVAPTRRLLLLWYYFWSKIFRSRYLALGRSSNGHRWLLDERDRLPYAHPSTIICTSQIPQSLPVDVEIAPRPASPSALDGSTYDETIQSLPDTVHNSEFGRRPHILEVNTSLTTSLSGDRHPLTAVPVHEGGSPSAAHYHPSGPTLLPVPQPVGSMPFSVSPMSSYYNLHTPINDYKYGECSPRPASIVTYASQRSKYRKYTGPVLSHAGFDARLSSSRLVAPPNDGHPGSPVLTIDFSYVYPVSVINIRRYGRTEKIDSNHSLHTIPELKLDYPEFDEPLPHGWVKPFHPEGAYYFMHKEKRIFTHADIWEEESETHMMGFADYLWNQLRELNNARLLGLNLSDMELVVELEYDESRDALVGRYYFVSPQHRYVFWLTAYDGEPFLGECKGVHLLSHKKLAVNAQYWHHLELFPNLCRLSQGMITELKYMLLQARCDHTTSDRSAAPYNPQMLSELSSIVKDLRPSKNQKDTINSVWIVGRTMHTFAHNQFINFHGQKGARLDILQSVHGESPTRSTTMFFLSHVFFGAPIVYVQALDTLFVDGFVCIFTWTKFLENLNSDLQEFNLLATVLLNANVGFLAIQSVDDGSGANDNTRSATQIVSYLSLVASVGSIILGLVLVRHTRTKMRVSASAAASFLDSMSHRKYGQETLALIYSLPSALLMWGMLFFLAAFSFECYKPQDNLSRLLVGIASFAVGLLVAWCIYSLRSERNGRGTGWWKIFLPLGMQKLYPRSINDGSTDDGESQLSLHSRLWKKLVSSLRAENPIEMQACGSCLENGIPPVSPVQVHIREPTRTASLLGVPR